MSGKGVKVLEENNIQFVIGILEMECQQLIKVFRKYVTRHIPYVLIIFDVMGVLKSVSHTIRIGFLPFSNRHVSKGSS